MQRTGAKYLILFLLLTSSYVLQAAITSVNPVDTFFQNFDQLAKTEKWGEIVNLGNAALEVARKSGRMQDEAIICAKLTSTTFFQGDYVTALEHASRCHELAEHFQNPSLFIRSLYLESAVYRALAQKENDEVDAQLSFKRAVDIAEEAVNLYFKKGLNNDRLLGKIYFNLGAAHADNPQGNLEQALYCYSKAIQLFKKINLTNDIIRMKIRTGKVYLLQQNFVAAQKMVDEIRPQITNERLSMHADYLEAQIKLAIHDLVLAESVARSGIVKAQKLGAREDLLRLTTLLQKIELEKAAFSMAMNDA